MGVPRAESIAQRIRRARDDAGLTQDDLARMVGLDRSSLAKVETGSRKVSALELAQIADHLGVRIEWFVDDDPPAVISQRNAREPRAQGVTIERTTERVARAVEFVMTHDPGLAVVPALEPFPRPTERSEIDELALQARELLGVPFDEPFHDLAAAVARVGLLAFSLDLGAEAADGASMHLGTGGIAIVNGQRHVGRRRLTLAHELGHFLFGDEYSVDWHVADPAQVDTRESTIDHFARALLLPMRSIETAWEEHRSWDRSLRETAVITASQFRVDMATLARRAYELGLVDHDGSDQIRRVKTTKADIVNFDLLIGPELDPPELPRAYAAAVVRLYQRELISGARALGLLFDTWDESDLPALAPLPEDAIWSFVS